MEIRIKFTPGYTGQPPAPEDLRASLLLHMPGAQEPKRIDLVGDYPLGQLAPRDKTVDFGAVSVGLAASRILTLKNFGEQEAHFRVAPNAVVQVSPMIGRVAAGASIDLELKLEAAQAQNISSVFVLETRASTKPLRLPIKANAVLPALSVREERVDFGQLYVGGTVRREFTVANVAAVSGRAMLDLSLLPEFSLELPPGSWAAKDGYEHCPVQSAQGDKLYARSMSRANSASKGKDQGTLSFRGGQAYTIQVMPEKTLLLALVYKPHAPGLLDIEMPIQMPNLDGA